MSPPLDLSLVIPCHNEEKNLQPLVSAIHSALDSFGIEYEIMITFDASTDDSWRVLKELAGRDPHLRIQRWKFNCGESAASWAGMQASQGQYTATLDADLQNDPKDLPAMLEALKNADCVCGTRAATRSKGDNWVRIVSSRIANWVRNKLSGEEISDAGCTYRVFKREYIARVKFFNGAPLPSNANQDGRFSRSRSPRVDESAPLGAPVITVCGIVCSNRSVTCWGFAG
jgi:glycosyltransferase involved in cell wall biosynthesis